MANEWYYLVGQRQVGPVTREEVVAAAQRGEVTHATYVWTEGMEQWAPAGTLEGLLPPAVPAPPQPPPPPFGVSERENAPTAVASLVCGILSIVCCCGVGFGIAAIILGFMARSRISDEPGRYRGEQLATIGIILGVIGLALTVAGGVFFHAFHPHYWQHWIQDPRGW